MLNFQLFPSLENLSDGVRKKGEENNVNEAGRRVPVFDELKEWNGVE